MWPDLFGPGWTIQLLVAGGLFTCIVALIAAMIGTGSSSAQDPPDEFQRLWHRCEVGDLTRQEFDRYRRQSASVGVASVERASPRRRVRYSLTTAQSVPVTRRMKSPW
jgi:hypothetical protein